jgi:hypothetical protein
MPEYPDTKAKRRRRIKETFPPPLNEIAIRHVDSVQALSDVHRTALALALQHVGLPRSVDCLEILKKYGEQIANDAELIDWLGREDRPVADTAIPTLKSQESSLQDTRYLATLLIKCFPDMPLTSAEALVLSEVMAECLAVVTATRSALESARSDFVIIALYSIFEERMEAISKLINCNPAFMKAIQRSHPDWKSQY